MGLPYIQDAPLRCLLIVHNKGNPHSSKSSTLAMSESMTGCSLVAYDGGPVSKTRQKGYSQDPGYCQGCKQKHCRSRLIQGARVFQSTQDTCTPVVLVMGSTRTSAEFKGNEGF